MKPIRIGYHILFWSVYLLLNGLVACVLSGWSLTEYLPYAMYREAYSLPVKLALTYFIFYYVIPLYLERSKLRKLVLLTLLSFAIATFFYRIIINLYFEYIEEKTFTTFSLRGIVFTVFDLYITITSATIIKMIKLRYKSQEVEEQLIREKLQSELSFLRAQTNPHFLFNTLNNLYVLARKKSDKTADAIMMLSKIMRFVLYDCRAPRISVADEAKVIQDYIELEKLRYNDRLTVRYTKALEDPHTAIAPLLLLPFVENSFKHGANSTTGKAEIHIDLNLQRNVLIFKIENTAEIGAEPSTLNGGIGLKNVQRQLDLLYPGRHELTTKREDGWFRAELKIELWEE
ncbi:MAG: histidine kinase [Saprospiraceae bacterium]|nr:histidine kinase [Saprospiraceae bacterium]